VGCSWLRPRSRIWQSERSFVVGFRVARYSPSG